MATEPNPETGSTWSEQLSEGKRDEQQPRSPSSPPAEGGDLVSATKRNMRQLIQQMKQMFNAYINLTRTETHAVTA
ncbi:Hypothetical predicted protein [Pelobates cultripes]|uniref:Uncharacterized protein n=1 Tax=Pelobates cultripes TaxID=61616 RepID=A0AAD1S0V2_PELCU|nr:Hypothetical predicted protein [Pelobates cultripes]